MVFEPRRLLCKNTNSLENALLPIIYRSLKLWRNLTPENGIFSWEINEQRVVHLDLSNPFIDLRRYIANLFKTRPLWICLIWSMQHKKYIFCLRFRMIFIVKD
ncbi:MAG: hypothetical protein ACR5LA_09710 [Wolbachia sp.]